MLEVRTRVCRYEYVSRGVWWTILRCLVEAQCECWSMSLRQERSEVSHAAVATESRSLAACKATFLRGKAILYSMCIARRRYDQDATGSTSSGRLGSRWFASASRSSRRNKDRAAQWSVRDISVLSVIILDEEAASLQSLATYVGLFSLIWSVPMLGICSLICLRIY